MFEAKKQIFELKYNLFCANCLLSEEPDQNNVCTVPQIADSNQNLQFPFESLEIVWGKKNYHNESRALWGSTKPLSYAHMS